MGEFSHVWRGDMTDVQLAALWKAVMDCGRDDSIRDAVFTQDGFVKFARRPDVYLWAILFRGVPLALFWLTAVEGRTAYAHFVQFPTGVTRTKAGIPVQVAAGLYAVSSALWRGGMDTLLGVTPVSCRPALKLLSRMGAAFVGVVPGSCWNERTGKNDDAVYSFFNKTIIPAEFSAL